MERRTFLHSITTSLAGLAVAKHLTPANARLGRVGLELYSVRNAMRRDPERTLAAVRAMGYSDVELLWSFGNFSRTPQQVRASLDHEGLRAPSAHVSPAVILVGWQRSLDIATLLGHEYLIVPSFTVDTQRSLDDWREWADRFNEAGAVARRAGIWLAFHNEPDHMKPIDGVVPYDVFVERTDPSVVRLQLDLGNMAVGGADPFAYLSRYRARYWSFHIKDVVRDHSHDTELGRGVLDVRRFLGGIPELDRKPVYVEQEEASDELASARQNYRYLSTLEF
jgi:sugar phosphate isomerase/epimerase